MNTANQSPDPPVRPPPDGYEWLADVYARVVAPEGAHETVRYALANDRIEPGPILRDQHGEKWKLPRRTWDKDGSDQALRKGWAQLNMDYPDPSGFYAAGHIFVPKGRIESFLGIGSRPPRDEDTRKPGESKPETIANWKVDYESVVHFLLTEQYVNEAANKAAFASPRSAPTIERNYLNHLRDRINRDGRKTAILCFCDFDPSGWDMPTSMATTCELELGLIWLVRRSCRVASIQRNCAMSCAATRTRSPAQLPATRAMSQSSSVTAC